MVANYINKVYPSVLMLYIRRLLRAGHCLHKQKLSAICQRQKRSSNSLVTIMTIGDQTEVLQWCLCMSPRLKAAAISLLVRMPSPFCGQQWQKRKRREAGEANCQKVTSTTSTTSTCNGNCPISPSLYIYIHGLIDLMEKFELRESLVLVVQTVQSMQSMQSMRSCP